MFQRYFLKIFNPKGGYQEKEILAKMETHAKRLELMSKLIEKGLEDGTITREEAWMLMPKRR